MKESTRRQRQENARQYRQFCDDRKAGEVQMVQTIAYLIHAQNYYLTRIAELEQKVAALTEAGRS